MTTIGRASTHSLRTATLAVVLAVGVWTAGASAQQSTVPEAKQPAAAMDAEVAPAEGSSSFAGTELRRSSTTDGAGAGDSAAAADEKASPSTGFGTVRVLLSLGVVVGIIFGLKHFGQRWFVPGAVKGSNRTVETLSRTFISPRQQVLLIRVGRRRVLVVGDSGGRLSPLDQITDADEIAELTAGVRSEKAGPVASMGFANAFGKSTEKFEADTKASQSMANVEPVDSSVMETQSDLAGLLEKVRGVSSRLGR